MRLLETRRNETVVDSLRLTDVIDRRLDDGGIASRVVDGEVSALAPALDTNGSGLNRYAFRLVGDRDVANALAQDAFVNRLCADARRIWRRPVRVEREDARDVHPRRERQRRPHRRNRVDRNNS
jgi:hypothetical protein